MRNLDMYAMLFSALVTRGAITAETTVDEASDVLDEYIELFKGAMKKYASLKEPHTPMHFE